MEKNKIGVENQLLFRLYINTRSEDSADIIQRLNELFKKNIKTGFVLEVIDVIKDFGKAVKDDVLASPTLLKVKPEPKVRIVGNLNYRELFEDLQIEIKKD